MASDSSRDSGIARHSDDLVTTVAPKSSAEVPAGPMEDRAWRRISLGRSFACLMIPVVILVLISGSLALATQWSSPESVETVRFWFYFFDVGREINLPTCSAPACGSPRESLPDTLPAAPPGTAAPWALFCLVCLVFSIDETLELHERLDVIGAELSRYLPLQLGFTWVIPGVLIAGLIGLSLLRMVLALPRDSRAGLLAAGIIFVAGGVGVETLSGFFVQGDTLPWQFPADAG